MLRHDLVTGETTAREFGRGNGVGEFVFVPNGPDAAEDDGVVMGIVHDAATQTGLAGDPRLPRRSKTWLACSSPSASRTASTGTGYRRSPSGDRHSSGAATSSSTSPTPGQRTGRLSCSCTASPSSPDCWTARVREARRRGVPVRRAQPARLLTGRSAQAPTGLPMRGNWSPTSIALIDALGVDRVHLVGHDWGAAVAWGVAAQHPDRIATLATFSVPHRGRSFGRSSPAASSWRPGTSTPSSSRSCRN